MYEEFSNLFGDIDKRIEDGNIIIEGDVNINIIESAEKEESKKGKTALKTIRNSAPVKKWTQKIKARDGFCQCCGETPSESKNLQAHHIMPLAKYSELKSDEGNGIALCNKCHSKYHQMYAGSEDAATFAKFMKDFGNRRY